MEVEKTYELILKKKEEQLSRDALLERQATQLTKYFIRARQRELKDTVEKQVEQSRKHYVVLRSEISRRHEPLVKPLLPWRRWCRRRK